MRIRGIDQSIAFDDVFHQVIAKDQPVNATDLPFEEPPTPTRLDLIVMRFRESDHKPSGMVKVTERALRPAALLQEDCSTD